MGYVNAYDHLGSQPGQDLWPFIEQWMEWADWEVDAGAASAYRHCAEMLIQIAGVSPRALA